ncbi:hypothetical protein [Streptomyces albidoflavus]|uniref:hypothetical protein n=1 Tax=Streptomyces albidoflavus TaxID=1886 RepID=UPI0033E376E5
MDPVSLEQLVYELRSPDAEKLVIPADKVTPGCVIASGSWEGHVVTAPLTPLSTRRLLAPLRHLNGGHNAKRRWSPDESVTIYRHRLSSTEIHLVPTVPHPYVPDAPRWGDRLYHFGHEVHRLGIGSPYVYGADGWSRATETSNGRHVRREVHQVKDIRPIVASRSGEASPYGWYNYLPVGHRAHLYVDGRPMLARSAGELVVGDVMRLPGHGRLEVADIARHAHSTTLTLRLLRRSIYDVRHLMWGATIGATGEQIDSGRTGSLYPVEPRAGELLTASEIQPGDTVITSWGARYSDVAEVEDVARQPFRPVMHVHATTSDGRTVRTQTGLRPQYLLLHRSAAAVSAPLPSAA